MDDYKINGRRSLPEQQIRLRRHILPTFGSRRAASIGPTEIKSYIVKRLDKGASNATINRELGLTRRAFNLRVENQKVAAKPLIRMLKEANVRQGFFERDQFEAVRSHLPEVLRPMVTVFYVTGWRLGEILSLEWHQVDFEVGRLYLEPGTTKNDEARLFPFTEDLRAALTSQRAYTERIEHEYGIICRWVFHRKGKHVKGFRRSWKKACRLAGAPGRIPHDFRRTAVRNLVRVGVPEAVATKLTGHRTRDVFERYNIVSDRDLEEAARKLDNVTKSVTIPHANIPPSTQF